MARDVIDLGDEHTLTFMAWAPDRDLNPQYDGIPDVERFAASIEHRRPDNGERCTGAVTFDGEVARELAARGSYNQARWTVESWDPLTLSPSVLCECGDHGFIREGRWVRA